MGILNNLQMTPQNVAMINNLHKIVKFCVNVLGVDNELTVDQLVGQDITYSGQKMKITFVEFTDKRASLTFQPLSFKSKPLTVEL